MSLQKNGYTRLENCLFTHWLGLMANIIRRAILALLQF